LLFVTKKKRTFADYIVDLLHTMKLEEILTLIEGTVVTNMDTAALDFERAFTSDLMSDVLTIRNTDGLLIITGLANLQTIRTVEMAGINLVILTRGKKATPDMIELAEENDIAIIETKMSSFRASAMLYNASMQPLF
jgi:predicted transcriptional regulator